jgi:uncharacterized protein YbbC (DUF1343 family)
MHRTIAILCLFISLFVYPAAARAALVKTGAEVLLLEEFSRLKGKSIGLVTNHSAVVNGVHLIDLMIQAGTPPSVIFTPEHGLQGTAEDGVHVGNGSYAGIPVISLYGAVKKPPAEDLAGLDLMIFDIQDVGVRFYTYISTMGLAMQAAAEKGIPFMVLDRPNPLGGNYVAGFTRKELPATFTAFYPIPIAHGMTVGELALMVRGAAMLSGLERLEIVVVKMEGWQRWMRWPDTGLPWVPTSPNIPDFQSALLYPGTGLLEATGASEGRGTLKPFRLVGWAGIDREQLARDLNEAKIPGLRFEPLQFVPLPTPGKTSVPKQAKKLVDGVELVIEDQQAVEPVEAGIAVVRWLYEGLSEGERQQFFRQGFEDMTGSAALRPAIRQGKSVSELIDLWSEEKAAFLEARREYLLYENRPTEETSVTGGQ